MDSPLFTALPKSSSFHVSPHFLSGTLPLPHLWDFHQEHSAGHPLFIYAEPDGTTSTIVWSQAITAMHRAARFLEAALPGGSTVVGILAYPDVPTTWAILTAVLRLGATAFMLSPTNSAPMLTTLLRDADCSAVIIGTDSAIGDTVRTAEKSMANGGSFAVLNAPSYEQLYGSRTDLLPIDRSELPQIELDSPALIMHTSGSSNGSPTLVTSSHRALVHYSMQTYFGDTDICGCVFGSQTFFLYHNTGISAYLLLPSTAGEVSTIFNPHQPPKAPTADNVLLAAELCKAEYLYTVPAFIEEWAANPTSVESLRAFKTILFAGSPVKTHIGKYLAARGVCLSSMYGTSECGNISVIAFDVDPVDWEYIRPSHQAPVLWEPHPDSDLFGVVVVESPFKRIAKPNTTRLGGRPAYSTGDLFEKHPEKDGLWRVYGRADTLVVHSTGRKTDPIPIESAISKHPLVQHALVFGQGQPRAGVLIWPCAASEQGALNDTTAKRLLEETWPAIQEVNELSPAHSRIIKETVIVASVKPFSLTDKRTLRRGPILSDYAEEIAAVFNALPQQALDT